MFLAFWRLGYSEGNNFNHIKMEKNIQSLGLLFFFSLFTLIFGSLFHYILELTDSYFSFFSVSDELIKDIFYLCNSFFFPLWCFLSFYIRIFICLLELTIYSCMLSPLSLKP